MNKPPARQIVREVCEKYGTTLDKIRERVRPNAADRFLRTIPQGELCVRLREDAGLTLVQIAQLIDRDHATVISAINQQNKRVSDLRAKTQELEGRVHAHEGS